MPITTSTFPNGQQLVSSANAPLDIETIFQSMAAQIFGFDVTNAEVSQAVLQQAWDTVRVAWQAEGQPAWSRKANVCIVRATLDDDPFSRTRDGLWADVELNAAQVQEQQSYTQVWSVHFMLYGPTAAQRARLLASAFFQDWVHDALVPLNLYALANWPRPVYAPELFEGQYWNRFDYQLKFNEFVSESIIVPSVAEMDVTLVKENGLTESIQIRQQ